MTDRFHRLPDGGYILQRGDALQVAIPGPVPTVLRFTGESLAALLTAAQAAFRERPKLEHNSRGGRVTALMKKSWRVG